MQELHDSPLPEPSLLTLVTGLAAQAMVSLGIFPNPIDGQTRILLHQGKHFIDTIAMLSEKTSGQQTPEEAQTFENVLHELRMIYVAAQNEKAKNAEPSDPVAVPESET
ncbi:MAG: DUF1844 domain-containing protein [Planctomycetaceae bacterium]|nr:DUF1844 domain-containing protein [Planctomycetaceae bacterium]